MIGTIGGGPVGAGVGIVAGHLLKPHVAGLLGGVGSKLDQVLGTSQPSLIKEGAAAAQMLQASGLPIPDTRGDLLAAIQQQRSALGTQAQMMGLDPARYAAGQGTGAVSTGSASATSTSGPTAANDPSEPAAVSVAANRAAVQAVLGAGHAPGATPLSPEMGGVLAQASARAGRQGGSGVTPAGVAGGLEGVMHLRRSGPPVSS